MARFHVRSLTFAVAITLLGAAWCGALQLLAPTEGQAVRERVKIQVPADAVPEGGFISVLVGEPGAEKFVVAIARDSAKAANNTLTFFWNSKAPYYDTNDPMKPLYFKDGRYPVTVQIHDAKGKAIDSAQTSIEIKNRVPRTNPAPGIALANKLAFGQINNYRVHCDVSVFEIVNQIGLPMFGGMGLSGDMLIIQSVEDARSGGQYLVRLRSDEKTYVSSYGVKSYLYAGQELKPQLYRLINKYGEVVTANLFAKQAKYQIMDLLPVLPSGAKKEGDSWPDTMTLKIDGLTPYIKLKGSAMLDSFEWQDGRECAKITSVLSGNIPINLANGKIKGSGPVNAEVTTYFAYKSGMMLERDIRFTFDASLMPGAGDAPNGGQGGPNAGLSPPSDAGSMPYADESADPYGNARQPGGRNGAPNGGVNGTANATDTGAKKGRVELDIVVRLEK
jgi:hypothetical protein